jgi:transposase
VFLDESGINAKSGERTHGWGRKGKIVTEAAPYVKAENYSVLPGMTVDGYIACNVYQGSVNRERFKSLVEHDLLPHCNAYPGPRSVIVMDNASIHDPLGQVSLELSKLMQEIKRMIEEKGCRCEYLPPYSPDFNPIEYSFSVIKKVVKNQYQLWGDETPHQMAQLVLKASIDAITPQIARNQFRHCMIYCGED